MSHETRKAPSQGTASEPRQGALAEYQRLELPRKQYWLRSAPAKMRLPMEWVNIVVSAPISFVELLPVAAVQYACCRVGASQPLLNVSWCTNAYVAQNGVYF